MAPTIQARLLLSLRSGCPPQRVATRTVTTVTTAVSPSTRPGCRGTGRSTTASPSSTCWRWHGARPTRLPSSACSPSIKFTAAPLPTAGFSPSSPSPHPPPLKSIVTSPQPPRYYSNVVAPGPSSMVKNTHRLPESPAALRTKRSHLQDQQEDVDMTSYEIPTEQWAQVCPQIGGPLEYKKVPVLKPGPDQVLVNVKYSGVCHTDLHAMNGDWPLPVKMPLIGGHEGAGVVVARGELVKDVEIGDHVGIKWLHGSCLSCSFCQTADEPLCPHAQLSGYTVDGSFQQYALAVAAHVARIPKELPLDAVAPVLCAGITVYKGLKESGARPGQWVAIVGAGGGLGNMAIQYATAMGLHTIAIDGGAAKGEACAALGAKAYIDFTTSKDLVADVKAATPDGFGPHAAILLAVAERPFQQAADYVRPRGSVIAIGLPAGAKLSAPVFDTVVKMISIKGSYVGNRADTAEAIDFYARGLIKAPFKVVGLSELQNVFNLMKEGQVVGRYVVDTSK